MTESSPQQPSPQRSLSVPAHFKRFKRFKVLDALYHNEPVFRYFTLLVSSIVLSVVSFYTTYLGFLALTERKDAAAALGAAIQCTLFWTARELARRGTNSKELILFIISGCLSVTFSYVSIVDALAIRSDSGIDLKSKIIQSSKDLQARKDITARVMNLCLASAKRWDDMKFQEEHVGSSTGRPTKSGKGGLFQIYTSYAKQDRDLGDSLEQTLSKLAESQQKLTRSQRLLDQGSEESAAILFRDVVNDIKAAYLPQELTEDIRQIRAEEKSINDQFFKPYYVTLEAKDPDLVPDVPDIIPPPFSITSVVETPLKRAEAALRELFSRPSWKTVLAAVMAIGLDFMVLICSFATNFGVPLRVVPNQELVVDALLLSPILANRYPNFLERLKLHKRRPTPTLEINADELPVGEKVPFFDLVDKHKIRSRNGSIFEISPDLLYYLLSEVYYGGRHNEIALRLAEDPYVQKLIHAATFRGGELQLEEKEIPAGVEHAIALLNLEISGLLKKRGFWKSRQRFVFSRELIESSNILFWILRQKTLQHDSVGASQK